MLKFDSEIDNFSARKSIRNAGIASVLISLLYGFEIINAIVTPPVIFNLANIFAVLLMFFFFYLSYRIFLGKSVAMITFFLIFISLVLLSVYFTEERAGAIGFMFRCMLGYFLLKGIEAIFWIKKQNSAPHSYETSNEAN